MKTILCLTAVLCLAFTTEASARCCRSKCVSKCRSHVRCCCGSTTTRSVTRTVGTVDAAPAPAPPVK